jgi:hypothetical protein
MQEVHEFEVSLVKVNETYLKNKIHTTGLRAGTKL